MKPAPHASLEYLRTLAALAVVGVHAAARVLVALPGKQQDDAWWTANLMDALCHWCVPVFVMISGALLLGRENAEPALMFYRRRLARLWRPVLGWTLFYLTLLAATEPDWNLRRAAASLLRGAPYYHLWYLYMLPGLYLITPFLRRMIAASSRRELRLLMLACCTLAALGTLTHQEGRIFLTSFLPFTGYFIAGHYLFTQAHRPDTAYHTRMLWALMIVAGLGVALGAGLLRPWLGERGITLMYAYPNPLVWVMGFCMFRIGLLQASGKQQQLTALCIALAPLSFGIYLIHPVWLLALAHVGIDGFLWHPAIGIPLTTLSTFALSALSIAALQRIPILRYTVQ
ncbi:MAG: putative integral rane protein [Proteobacteria bacterium]|nr:putative integral rane protein [Pseudomonadota bacterium]